MYGAWNPSTRKHKSRFWPTPIKERSSIAPMIWCTNLMARCTSLILLTVCPPRRTTIRKRSCRSTVSIACPEHGTRYQGKKLNSPNDLVYKSDGSLYFTDPPYGLPTQEDNDPQKELQVNGVYRMPGARHQISRKEVK